MTVLTEHEQLKTLAGFPHAFAKRVEQGLSALSLNVLQINVGKVCNQACHHCHVDASPTRTESMNRTTAEQVMRVLEQTPQFKVVDITGGAPEINPHFKYLVTESKRLGRHVMDRCNLTILEQPGYEDLYAFLSEHQVEVVASLPYFSASRTDAQRGKGVFDQSIIALKKLNQLGYGQPNSPLKLNLVYNPSGAFLSGMQAQLEREFKQALREKFQIEFDQLFCINNMPISRFLQALIRKEKFQEYMETLANAFNPATVEGLMCRHQISVGYDGRLYDCDFNQMLGITTQGISHIKDWNTEKILNRSIVLANHCYGCTAGAGSSCGGELA